MIVVTVSFIHDPLTITSTREDFMFSRCSIYSDMDASEYNRQSRRIASSSASHGQQEYRKIRSTIYYFAAREKSLKKIGYVCLVSLFFW